MYRVKSLYSLQAFSLCIIATWLDFRPMVDRRLVSLTEDLYENIVSMATDYEDRNFEIVQLLDQRLAYNGLDMDEETIEDLAKYYIEKRA